MIHPSAVIDPRAQIGTDVHIGPYCVIGPYVTLHDHVHLHNHVAIEGHTIIGEFTSVYSFACLGAAPQNQNYYDDGSMLTIGQHNVIREYTTIQPGIKKPRGNLKTTIGNHNLIMSHVIVSHDCAIGDNCVVASQVGLAGHVVVDDHVIIGGSCGIHQWVHVGRYAMIGGLSGVAKDVLPYALVHGSREAKCHGPNIIGLKRNGFTNDQIRTITSVYTALKEERAPMVDKITTLKTTYRHDSTILHLLDFIDISGKRGLTDWM